MQNYEKLYNIFNRLRNEASIKAKVSCVGDDKLIIYTFLHIFMPCEEQQQPQQNKSLKCQTKLSDLFMHN